MPNDKSDCDVSVVVGAFLVFVLPLTLLVPDFSIWDVVPKVQVTRWLVVSQQLTWPQLNTAVVGLLSILFCLFLEMRKRKLDDMVECALTVNQATDICMEMERERQATALKVCAELLDSSSEHYEHLVLLQDELHNKQMPLKQAPPTVEPSSSIHQH